MRLIEPLDINESRLDTSNAPGSSLNEWASGTTYDTGDQVKVSDTGVNKEYESLTNGNQGNYPPDNVEGESDPPQWLEIGSINDWAMFDGRLADQTESSAAFPVGTGNGIQVEITPSAVVNGMALFNLQGQSVRVEMDDPTDGIVYDKTYSLNNNDAVEDWYSYFYEPIETDRTLLIDDLPSFGTATFRVSIANPTDPAKCGFVAMGRIRSVGRTQYGSTTGITDYSRKERDQFGRATIKQRSFNARGEFDINVEAGRTSFVENLLADLRATPVVYYGSPSYKNTIIYGYYRDFTTVISNFSFSELSIEIEGLT